MALPVLQNSGGPLALGGSGGIVIEESADQKAWRDGMAAAVQAMYNTLVDILDVQKDILAVLRGDRMDKDAAAEAGTLKDTSLDTKQKTTMFDDLKNIQAQAGDFMGMLTRALLAAAVVWGNDLEKYVSTVLLPTTIKKFQSLISFITKIVSGIKTIFSAVLNDFAKLVKPIKDFLSGKFSIITKIANGIRSVVDLFATKLLSAGEMIKAFVTKFEIVRKGIASLSAGAKTTADIVGKIAGFFGSIGAFFSRIFTAFKGFISASKTVGAVVSAIGKMMTPVKAFLAGLGPIISKILWPIQVVMSIFDFVKGFEQTEGNIVEKFIGGITEIFTGLFMKPLDLLKDLLSWTAEKLGFEDFSKWLDSFSFEDIFKSGIELVVNFYKNIPYVVLKLMKGALAKIPDWVPGSGAIKKWANSPTGKPSEFKLERGTKEEQEQEQEKAAASTTSTTPMSQYTADGQKKTRGERNNNPGNVRASPWTKKQPGYVGEDSGGFAIFDTPESGRAVQNQLLSNYGGQAEKGKTSPRGYPLNTVRGIVDKWAPTNENQTDTYIDFVSKKSGLDPDKPLDMNDMATVNKLSSAMTIKELGYPSAARFEQSIAKPQLDPNVTVPSAVTSGMSMQAKQAERMQSQVKVAPSIVNAPTNVTNNTVASGGGGSSGGTSSRSSSNPSERRVPVVTIGIRG